MSFKQLIDSELARVDNLLENIGQIRGYLDEETKRLEAHKAALLQLKESSSTDDRERLQRIVEMVSNLEGDIHSETEPSPASPQDTPLQPNVTQTPSPAPTPPPSPPAPSSKSPQPKRLGVPPIAWTVLCAAFSGSHNAPSLKEALDRAYPDGWQSRRAAHGKTLEDDLKSDKSGLHSSIRTAFKHLQMLQRNELPPGRVGPTETLTSLAANIGANSPERLREIEDQITKWGIKLT